jgi:hypothetical protein
MQGSYPSDKIRKSDCSPNENTLTGALFVVSAIQHFCYSEVLFCLAKLKKEKKNGEKNKGRQAENHCLGFPDRLEHQQMADAAVVHAVRRAGGAAGCGTAL